MPKQRYGIIADTRDARDYKYKAPLGITLPAAVDLRSLCPEAFDQGDLGSCGPNAAVGAFAIDEKKQGENVTIISRLMLYYVTRALMGTTSYDSGVEIRTLVKALQKTGACPESEYPYNISIFKKKPPKQCYADARKAVLYQRVDRDLDQLKGCLADNNTIIIGFSVYESFESNAVAQTGIMPMPTTNSRGRITEKLLGGHAVVVVGYDDSRQVWICRNSWSSQWGDQGYFYMPYGYLLDPGLSSDFWTITKVDEETLQKYAQEAAA